MRKNRIAVWLMTALLLLVMALAELMLMQSENFPFCVEVKTKDGSEKITYWDTGECYYVFLPSGADPNEVKMVCNPLFPVWIDGERVKDGTVCGEFPFDTAMSLTYRKWGQYCEQAIFFCQSQGVPTLYIDTASGSMDYIHQEKGNAEAGSLRLYLPDGTLDCGAQIKAINGRGNSTWNAEKKPYSLELAQKEDLLDMGAAKNWILLADAFDPTHISNKMCYDFAAGVGCAYTPQCQWVDLYLNGNYAGLYLLSERNEVDPQRVNIPKEGSFLISKEQADRWDGRNYSAFFSERGDFFRIHHDGMDADQIREIWQSVEDAVFSEDGIDPRTGRSWEELIDVDSWARQYLICDSFMDCDAGYLSKFFYYDPESELVFAGPLWDMDDIFVGVDGFSVSILASGRKFTTEWGKESLFCCLSQKDSFRQTLNQLYRQEFRPMLLELADTGMDRYTQQIQRAGDLNDMRWCVSDTGNVVAYRKSCLLERIGFYDEYLGHEEDYCTVSLILRGSDQWRSYAVRRGETADFLMAGGITWLDYETGEPFDVTGPVNCDWVIYEDGCKEG